jgi:tryptophanyl-tRNA synthetase
MRPTGRLHIGHYFGALQNWVKLQNDPQYECFFFIADWHALTSDYADTSAIAQNSIEIATDYLAAGLNPKDCTIFLQSLVPEHAELNLLLSMVTPLGWLERVPTYKEALENVTNKDLHTYGFLGYPILQTADIVMYGDPGQELLVPVGEDQVSHVELSREIVRRTNLYYGVDFRDELFTDTFRTLLGQLLKLPWGGGAFTAEQIVRAKSALRERLREEGADNFHHRFAQHSSEQLVIERAVLREPQAMLTATPRIPGTDGRKMSKSYNNFVSLSESDENIRVKTKAMVTDPARKRRTDPGNPDVCPVYDWHKLFSPPEVLKWSAEGCRSAGIGCIECKAAMADHLIRWIDPIRSRREGYEKEPARVLEILDEGSARAQKVSQGTMARVREAVFGWQKRRAEIKGLTSQVLRQGTK